MEKFRVVSLCFKLFLVIFMMLVPVSIGQLTPSETRILFQVQKLLEYPEVLQGWTNWTNFCYLPSSSSLKIVCSNSRVTELTVIGNKSSPAHSLKPTFGKFSVSQQSLSANFNIDRFFTILTKLSNLKVLSLVSLGLWGPLPSKINRFWSLEVLNISSNFIYGEIPMEITSLKNLKSIVLADNLLNGSVPDLQRLVLLEELNLGGNDFGPKFPSLSKNIVSVILRNNSLRSEIPSGLKNFDQLKQFDISSNNFVGPIQSFLFSLPSILYLNLAGNQLSEALPVNISCSAKLNFVDISHNLLIGKLPSCIGSNSLNRTVVSTWNCLSGVNTKNQHPYSFCRKEALAVKPPVNVKSDDEQSTRVNVGLILGIIGGVVGFVVVFGLLVLVVIRRSKTTGAGDDKYERSVADKMSVRGSPKPAIDSRRVPQTMRSAAIGLPPFRGFSLEEIEEATNNFDPTNLIGEGSQGQLYKGFLTDGSRVSVKCLKLKQRHLPQSLMQHVELLSKLRHRHLVSILGHCILTYQDHPNTGSTVFLVLEHISNGSLRDYLTDWKKKDMLKWPQRMAIIIGATRGVQFLHTGVAPGIFGNNLKTENILLDKALTAKLSGYNIPLPSKKGLESPLRGQYVSNQPEDGEKEDVYQLGVILLQVITGKLVKSTRDVIQEILPDNQNGSRVLITLTDIRIIISFQFEDGENMRLDLVPTGGPLRATYKGRPFLILYHGSISLEENIREAVETPLGLRYIKCLMLPFCLKPCFIYLSVFPAHQEISTRQLYQLWIAEGFIPDNSEATAESYLEQLIKEGFVEAKKRKAGGTINTCSIPGRWRPVLHTVPYMVEFICSPFMDPKGKSPKKAKRLNAVEREGDFACLDDYDSQLHSLLCCSPETRHLDPIDWEKFCGMFKLLRVLDLGSLVLIQYPSGIENLFLLRYLKLNIPSLNSLPSSLLSNLLNLYTLDMPFSYIDHTADEFWKMNKLRHLNFGSITLPAHPGKFCGSLENLNFISALHPCCCTEDILGRLPNLRNLRIRGDLSYNQSLLSKSLCRLSCLESLKLANESKMPRLSKIVLAEYLFPHSLTHLSFSNTDLMDDPMPTLEKLPLLQVLKLKQNSYSGRKLTCGSYGFPNLKVLHLKSMLWLEEWTMGNAAMPKLECLIINPCAYLKKMPEQLWYIKSLNKFDCWWPQPELRQKLREFEDKEQCGIQLYPYGI